MVIKKLTLHNFGVYAGTNTFSFENEKPVVLIGGMNGRGKTTFLNAVLISLYGPNSFAYKESPYKSYGQYLKSLVNEADHSKECFVRIEFKINTNDDDTYIVQRSWTSKNIRTKEELEVEKNYVHDAFLSDNWPAFFENILPSALAPYFFFDGDNIAELAVEATDDRMKSAIKALLGITVLDKLESDLSRLNARVMRKNNSSYNANKLDAMRDALEKGEIALREIDDKILAQEEELHTRKRQLEEMRQEYVAKGGVIVEQRQEMYQKRSELKAELQFIEGEKLSLASSGLPLVLVDDLIGGIYGRAKSTHDSIELGRAAQKINEIQNNYKNKDNPHVVEFVNYINSIAANIEADSVFDLSDSTLFQLEKLMKSDLDIMRQGVASTIDRSRTIEAAIETLDAQLSTDVDEDEVKKVFQKIKRLEQQIIEVSEVLSRLQRQRSEVNGRYLRASSDYKRYVESVLSELELTDDVERMQKYSGIAVSIIQQYRVRLQKQKVGVLTKTITQCFRQIANKQNLIDKIEMDHTTLDFIYLNKEGKIVPKASLSEGEKQMMIISILWALAICAKRKLPVIIDTPLARLDSAHRKSLISTYFPNAGEQTIILSTDSEINGDYYRMLKKHVSDEFTLIYDDQAKCTHIERGYFSETLQ